MTDAAFHNVRPALRLNGQWLPAFEEAVVSAAVEMPAEGRGHAELRLVNWGPDQAGNPDFRFNDIALGDALELFMGGDTESALFKGEVTGLEERYGEGAPQLVVLAEDRLHRLARRRAARAFEQQSADDVVRRLAADAGLQADVAISANAADWHQFNESDLAFIRRIAGRFGLQPRLVGDTLTVKAAERAAEPWRLVAGKGLIQARILADLNHQPNRARSLGHNPGSGEEASGESVALTPAPDGATAAQKLDELGWAGEELFPRPFPLNQGDAEAYAERAFAARASRFLHGDLVCAGDPRLTTGGEVELSGVSPRLAGRYAVTACSHHFAANRGYETYLKVARPDWNP